MEKSARNAIFKGFFQNSLLGTFESKQTLRQQIKKQTFPKATFQRILRILLGNQVYHTEDAYRIAKGGALLRKNNVKCNTATVIWVIYLSEDKTDRETL